jgi:hypothetical protein
MVLSADQNGQLGPLRGDAEDVIKLVRAGYFRWHSLTSTTVRLTPEAEQVLRARENVHQAKAALTPQRKWGDP